MSGAERSSAASKSRRSSAARNAWTTSCAVRSGVGSADVAEVAGEDIRGPYDPPRQLSPLSRARVAAWRGVGPRLQHEHEVVGHLARPSFEHVPLRHPVEGTLPFLVAKAARTSPEPHGTIVPESYSRRERGSQSPRVCDTAFAHEVFCALPLRHLGVRYCAPASHGLCPRT